MVAKLTFFPNRKSFICKSHVELVVIVVARIQEIHESVIQSLCIILKPLWYLKRK